MIPASRARSRRWSAVLGALVLVLTAACGDDDGEDADVATPTAPATSASSATPAAETTAPPDTGTVTVAPTAAPSGDGGLTIAGVDPCGLLEADAIAAVVGHPVVAGEPQPFSCLWDSETLEDSTVTVSLFTAPTSDVAGACADQRALDPDAPEVEGFGSTAWWVYNAVGPPYDSGDLWICVDDGIVAVGLSGAGDEALWRSQVEQLAAEVLDAL